MAVSKKQAKSGDTEAKVVALAEQLGWFLGTVQSRAEGWLDREMLRKEVAKIRDGAAQLLQHVDAASRSARLESARPKATARPGKAGPVVAGPAARKVAMTPKPDRGPVDAPGKRHRKPTPNVKLDKRMGEPVGKQMGQKNFKMGTGKHRISG